MPFSLLVTPQTVSRSATLPPPAPPVGVAAPAELPNVSQFQARGTPPAIVDITEQGRALARESARNDGAPFEFRHEPARSEATSELASAEQAPLSPEEKEKERERRAAELLGASHAARAAAPEQEQSPSDELKVRELAERDRQVRAHEQARQAAGGRFAGAARVHYQVGPDGQRYAVAIEVPLDSSEVRGDPDATIQKLNLVKVAALAPPGPTPSDQMTAANAAATLERVSRELRTAEEKARVEAIERTAERVEAARKQVAEAGRALARGTR